MKKYLISVAILMVSMIQTISSQKLTANVHPGVEVMSIVQIFAGKMAMPNKSNYAKDVENYFMPFANHPAIKKVQSLGDVYSDLTELGWVYSFPDFTFQAPTDTSLNWYKLYGKENVVEYLTLVAQFAKDSRFMEFYQKHENVYAQWGRQMENEIANQGLQEKLAAFYGFNLPDGRQGTEGGRFTFVSTRSIVGAHTPLRILKTSTRNILKRKSTQLAITTVKARMRLNLSFLPMIFQ